MHTFHDFVQNQIKQHNRNAVIQAFNIIDRHFEQGNSNLVTAIAVTYLEHFDLGLARGDPSWALDVLPSELRQPYEEFRNFMAFNKPINYVPLGRRTSLCSARLLERQA
jgi:hypothetical protein